MAADPEIGRAKSRNITSDQASAPSVESAPTISSGKPHQAIPPMESVQAWGRRYAFRLGITDLLILTLAAVAVHLFRLDDRAGAYLGSPAVRVPTIAVTLVLCVAWHLSLAWSGSRKQLIVGLGPTEYKRIGQSALGLFGSIAILSYLLDLDLPRSYLLLMMPVGIVGLFVTRFGWRRWLHRRRDFGHFQSAVLAVGSVTTLANLLNDLKRSPRAGYRVVAVCLTRPPLPAEPTMFDGLPILGGISDVRRAMLASGADTVALTASASISPTIVRNLSWELESTGAQLVLAPALTDIAGPRIHTQPVNGLPLIHVDKPTYRGANRILKRSFDLSVATLLLTLLAFPLAVIAVAVRLTSAGSTFFLQQRVGLNGELFWIVKFRTMYTDAEARLAELRRGRGGDDVGNDVLFKMKDDPRVTKVGKVLRRFSLDEVPQLLNVIAGTMSLVGPRPPLADEVEQYGNDARRRLLVKPGMTGLWQVSGRSDLNWEESVRLDSYYVENWSLMGDLVILWKTARAVVGGNGAY